MKREQLNIYIINENSSVVDALQQIDLNVRGILYVTNTEGVLVGSLTDGDVRRWLIKTGKVQGIIKSMMNKAPVAIYRQDTDFAQELMNKNYINSVPVISRKGKILDIIFREDKDKADNVQEVCDLKSVPVIIMAGGKGTRLYPFTKILPKPLIPIGNIPIMERIIDKFCDFGVNKYYTTVNYKKNMIKSYFSELDRDYDMIYVEEDKPLGTAGSIRLIEDKFDKPVIVTNCDILINADYSDIYKYHTESKNDMTIVSALKNIIVPYGVINTKENGTVISMDEKPKLSYFVNTGMYILNPDTLDYIPEDTFFHMTDLADKLLKMTKSVGMYPISEDSFLDMGEFEEMNRMEEKLNLKV